MSDEVHSILFNLKKKKARIMLSNLPPQIQYCVYVCACEKRQAHRLIMEHI